MEEPMQGAANHFHVSGLSFLITGAYVVIWGFLIHTLAAWLSASNDEAKKSWGGALTATGLV
jgi:hypothetical protein